MVTTTAQHLPALPQSFFARPAEVVAPELIGCLLVKRQPCGSLLQGVIVETEAYSQAEPACHGHRRRSPGNETLFGEPGRFYVYVSYGIHHCVNVVTDRPDWANGVLLRAVSLPGEPERTAAGPALLARRFGIDRRHDALAVDPALGLWLAPRPASLVAWLAGTPVPASPLPAGLAAAQGCAAPTAAHSCQATDPCLPASGIPQAGDVPGPQAAAASPSPLVQTVRIGISQGQELPWRWYLRGSRSVSRRARGDRPPRRSQAWAVEDWLGVLP